MFEKQTDDFGRVFDIIDKKDLKYIDTSTNAKKFWSCTLARQENPTNMLDASAPWQVIIYWGRIGTVGKKRERRFERENAAKMYMEQRVSDKIRKGYKEETTIPSAKQNTDTNGRQPFAGISICTTSEWDLF